VHPASIPIAGMNINDVKTAIRILRLPSFIKLEVIYNFAAWIVKRRGDPCQKPDHEGGLESQTLMKGKTARAALLKDVSRLT